MDTTSWSNSPHWNTFWGQFQIELIGGLISALFFLFIILLLFKPKIKIADFICKVSENEEFYYSFKFVNKSFFAAHNVKIALNEFTRIPSGNGNYNNLLSKLTLVSDTLSHVPGRPFFWQKKKDNPHCILIRSKENLNEILKVSTNSVQIKVSLNHGLTGLSNVFEKEYANETDIKMGKFRPGTKFASM